MLFANGKMNCIRKYSTRIVLAALIGGACISDSYTNKTGVFSHWPKLNAEEARWGNFDNFAEYARYATGIEYVLDKIRRDKPDSGKATAENPKISRAALSEPRLAPAKMYGTITSYKEPKPVIFNPLVN